MCTPPRTLQGEGGEGEREREEGEGEELTAEDAQRYHTPLNNPPRSLAVDLILSCLSKSAPNPSVPSLEWSACALSANGSGSAFRAPVGRLALVLGIGSEH